MIKKKVCLLGAFAVGKSSLIARFVHSMFDERYHTTIGVKIDKQDVCVDGIELTMVLWDLYGEDKFQRLEASYLRGADGFLIVVDGTRAWTAEHALEMVARAEEIAPSAPRVYLLNKCDLVEAWELAPDALVRSNDSAAVFRTSAKTGEGVERAFSELARRMARA